MLAILLAFRSVTVTDRPNSELSSLLRRQLQDAYYHLSSANSTQYGQEQRGCITYGSKSGNVYDSTLSM
jgi:hypothetical protein